jgi:predicted metal-dependent hydrolase
VQLFIRNVIEEALRIESKQFIPARVNELAAKYNFNYNKIFIKNIKSRWGSCSKKGNVNLSLHLMLLPEELIDYVIVHELAHTVEHNHSKNYWAVLNKIYGNAKTIDRKLKAYRVGIW